jgi:hypothetical protein
MRRSFKMIDVTAVLMALAAAAIVVLTPAPANAQSSCYPCGAHACLGTGGCVGYNYTREVSKYKCANGSECVITQTCNDAAPPAKMCAYWADAVSSCPNGCPQ